MVRFAAVFLAVALMVYGLVDCGQTRAHRTRYMPKAVWLVLIVILPIVGPLAWLLFGKNRETGTTAPRRRAPDEDPDFLWKLDRDVKRQQQRAEAERRAREAGEAREGTSSDEHGDTGASAGAGTTGASGGDPADGDDRGPEAPPPPTEDSGTGSGTGTGGTTGETVDRTTDEKNERKKDDT
jgi:hypothetical protein